ncbi:AAA family ATPase [Vagococcus hydrophili]|uniref:AAA family ATPase n=1 Tax=Vagococcus hydrophili TaxID=2714947 RepID=A0A6G8AQ60_9ENTE|nr:AAA family ATPase [Vagococcus hydrophili]QIL47063.1 AAA family ATPase [Vagococcus hydrophili]
MTEIRINSIHYKNFKGFKDYKLELDGKSAHAIGPNGAGKTSIGEGLTWLLFGKDLLGAKLNPKPKDKDKNEVLGLDPTIEAELVIDGKVVLMKRVQKENWTTKRGELEKTRGSDKTEYYIDAVPKKEKEWKEYLENIEPEEVLQIMTAAGFFMTLEWKNRRNYLISLTGLTDEEIIEMDPELKELESILDGKSIEDAKKILTSRKKKLQDDIKSLPGRIQENQDMLDRLALDELDKNQIESDLNVAQSNLEKAEAKVISAENGDSSLDFKEQVANLNIKLGEEKNKFLAGSNLVTENLNNDLTTIHSEGTKLRETQTSLQFEIDKLANSKKLLENDKEYLLKEYSELKVLNFDEHKKECSMCGQDLPVDQIEDLVAKFNLDKSNKVENNISLGKKAASDIGIYTNEINELVAKRQEVTNNLDKTMKRYNELKNELESQKQQTGAFEDTDSYKKIKSEIEELQQKIIVAKSDSSQFIQEATQERDKAKIEVNRLIELTFKLDQAIPVNERMAELRKEDSNLKTQNQEVERHLWLIDEFTRKKVKMLEESINNHFELTKFKLFKPLKNGGLDEVCEATYNGIDYSAGMSTGERGRCDLDIISGFSKSLNVSMPVFLDNAESITEPIVFDGQLIENYARKEKFNVEVK